MSVYSSTLNDNSYIPTTEATDNLVVGFSRSKSSFRFNKYTQLRPVSKAAGRFLKLRPDANNRLLYGDARNFRWAPGTERPKGLSNQQLFSFAQFQTERFSFPTTLDQKAVQQADWMVEAIAEKGLIQQACTARTSNIFNVLSAANWGSNTVANVSTLIGTSQTWANGTTSQTNIRKSVLKVASAIKKATAGVCDIKDLRLVVNPDTAIDMGISSEIVQAYIQSPYALDLMRGKAPVDVEWGLSGALFGCPIVIEDAVETTTGPGLASSSQTNGYVLPYGAAYFLTRPGDAPVAASDVAAEEDAIAKGTEINNEETPIVSTVIGFFYEEMTVEAFPDPENRLIKTYVCDDYCYVLSSALSGYYIGNVFA